MLLWCLCNVFANKELSSPCIKCSVPWGVVSTIGVSVLVLCGCSVPWGYHEYLGGYLEYRGGCSV